LFFGYLGRKQDYSCRRGVTTRGVTWDTLDSVNSAESFQLVLAPSEKNGEDGVFYQPGPRVKLSGKRQEGYGQGTCEILSIISPYSRAHLEAGGGINGGGVAGDCGHGNFLIEVGVRV
jgi:hypothetical protein